MEDWNFVQRPLSVAWNINSNRVHDRYVPTHPIICDTDAWIKFFLLFYENFVNFNEYDKLDIKYVYNVFRNKIFIILQKIFW